MGIAFYFGSRHRTNVLHDLQRQDHSPSWVYEEDAKDTGERIGACQTPAQEVEVVVMAKKNVGSSFDEFLEEEGLLEEATAAAVKRVIAFQLAERMSEHSLSKSEMARRMATSRSALDRLLDPDNVSVTLQTLQSAVQALGGRLNVVIDFDDKANAA